MSTLSILRKKAINRALESAKDRALANLYALPMTATVRVPTAVARLMILEAPYFVLGHLRELKVKNLGCGVKLVKFDFEGE